MTRLRAIVASAVLSAVSFWVPLAHASRQSTFQRSNIVWQEPCPNFPRLHCASLTVPYDYISSTESNDSFLLRVVRFPAKKERLGSIFVNFGGPGIGAEHLLSSFGSKMQKITGGRYDLISWDPRGVSKSSPAVRCFSSLTEEQAFWDGTVLHPGIEAPGDFSEQDEDAFKRLAHPADQALLDLAEKCKRQEPTILPYVGTAATVRDMIAIHDSIEDPGSKVNYWGFSYGTLIGLYLVNMVPDRAGRVVLEGVVDPEYWTSKPAHKSWSITAMHIDAMLERFALECIAAGDSCYFAGDSQNATALLAKLQTMITLAYDIKKQLGNESEVSSGEIRSSIIKHLPYPSAWSRLSKELYNYQTLIYHPRTFIQKLLDTGRAFYSLASMSDLHSNYEEAPHYAYQAVTCADAADSTGVTTEMIFEELTRVARDISPILGPAWGEGGLYCHRWTHRAVERYNGPWNTRLSNSEPLLIIGNSLDPVTPYESAEKVAHVFKDKTVLVKREAYGHLASWDFEEDHNTCTSLIEGYFVNGSLPPSDVTCKVKQKITFAGHNAASIGAIQTIINQWLKT